MEVVNKIAAGFIDNNGRKPLADWVRSRIKPQVDIFIDTAHIPSNGVDIVDRVKFIIKEAKSVDFLYLIENDDYYPEDYILQQERCRGDADFINSYKYIRYHIKSRQVQYIGHKKGKYNIGGLWTMGFRPELVTQEFLQFVPDHERFLDGYLCRWFQDRYRCVWNNDHKGVAIKGHGVGQSNPNGVHKQMNIPYMFDQVLHILEGLTDESFMKLHYPDHKYQLRKSNKEVRKYLQTFFPGVDELLNG